MVFMLLYFGVTDVSVIFKAYRCC